MEVEDALRMMRDPLGAPFYPRVFQVLLLLTPATDTALGDSRRHIGGKVRAIHGGPAADDAVGEGRGDTVDIVQEGLGGRDADLAEVCAGEVHGGSSSPGEVADRQGARCDGAGHCRDADGGVAPGHGQRPASGGDVGIRLHPVVEDRATLRGDGNSRGNAIDAGV